MKTEILKTIEEKGGEVSEIRKLQVTLMRIKLKEEFFFNIYQYVNLGLIKKHGKTPKNTTNWVLTEKGHRLLSLCI